MGIAENINQEILKLISAVKTYDPKNGSNKNEAKVKVINNVASTLKKLFKNNAQIKLESEDLATELSKKTGYTKISKTTDFDKSMKLLNDYINDYKEILDKYQGYNEDNYQDYKNVVFNLTGLQLQLDQASKRLDGEAAENR